MVCGQLYHIGTEVVLWTDVKTNKNNFSTPKKKILIRLVDMMHTELNLDLDHIMNHLGRSHHKIIHISQHLIDLV